VEEYDLAAEGALRAKGTGRKRLMESDEEHRWTEDGVKKKGFRQAQTGFITRGEYDRDELLARNLGGGGGRQAETT